MVLHNSGEGKQMVTTLMMLSWHMNGCCFLWKVGINDRQLRFKSFSSAIFLANDEGYADVIYTYNIHP